MKDVKSTNWNSICSVHRRRYCRIFDTKYNSFFGVPVSPIDSSNFNDFTRYSNRPVTVSISVQRSKVFKRCYSSATRKFVVQKYLCCYINCTPLRNGMYILPHNKIVMNYSGSVYLHFPIVFYACFYRRSSSFQKYQPRKI